MSGDPIGSLAEEAAKLIAAIQERAHDPASPECRYCPLCAVARVAKAATPEVRDHLAGAAMSLALAFKGLLDSVPERPEGSTPVEKIDLAED